jgi:hypothetical protein
MIQFSSSLHETCLLLSLTSLIENVNSSKKQAANSFFVKMQNTTLAEALGSGDKKEKVQKATQGIESKGDQHKFILSNRAFVELSFYLQAPKEISDNKEPHEPLFSGKAVSEQVKGPAQCILEIFPCPGTLPSPSALV